jgi:hypothetical protein
LNNAYQNRRAYGDLFLEPAKMVIGLFAAIPASFYLDTKCATDFTITTDQPHIAFRVRDSKYQQSYGNQFTLRCQVASGKETELDKILNGYGTWMLYCFGTEEPYPCFTSWTLIDLDSFRYHYQHNQESLSMGIKSNNDGSALAWFDITSFPDDYPLVIGSNRDYPQYWQ